MKKTKKKKHENSGRSYMHTGNYGHAVRKHCKERGKQRIKLNGIEFFVILKGEELEEELEKEDKISDCLIFIGNDSISIVIVELKSKTVHTSEIVEKMQNSIDIALRILESCSYRPYEPEIELFTVAEQWDSSEKKRLHRSRIPMRGRKFQIASKEYKNFKITSG